MIKNFKKMPTDVINKIFSYYYSPQPKELLDDIKNYISKISNIDLSNKAKIFATISLSWIIFIGYLTWWNGLKSLALDKSFRWDEWFWFGIVPALAPYIFYFIWRKKDE